MSQNKSYRIKKKLMSDTFEIPCRLIDKLADAGECELKIFLTLASLGDSDRYLSQEDIIAELEKVGVTSESFSEGMAFLRGAGLIESPRASKKKETEDKQEPLKAEQTKTPPPTPKASSKPSYTLKELASAVKNTEFYELTNYASHKLGRTLNNSDVATLYSFCDYLCLPCDVIMLSIEHCCSEGKSSLRYVEKLLIDFADREINTYQKAEEYIINRKKYLSFEGKIKAMLGFGQRSLSAKERAMLGEWNERKYSDDLIRLAYDKTVDKTGKASMSYMNKILDSWHVSGFKTVEQVEKGDLKPATSDFDPDDFLRVAVESSRK